MESVVIQLGWMMHHWAIGKRQKQGYFSLITACLIWCSTLFCRYMLSFSARGFVVLSLLVCHCSCCCYVAGDLPYSATRGVHSVWVTWEIVQLWRQPEKLWKQCWIYPLKCWGTGSEREEPLASPSCSIAKQRTNHKASRKHCQKTAESHTNWILKEHLGMSVRKPGSASPLSYYDN